MIVIVILILIMIMIIQAGPLHQEGHRKLHQLKTLPTSTNMNSPFYSPPFQSDGPVLSTKQKPSFPPKVHGLASDVERENHSQLHQYILYNNNTTIEKYEIRNKQNVFPLKLTKSSYNYPDFKSIWQYKTMPCSQKSAVHYFIYNRLDTS